MKEKSKTEITVKTFYDSELETVEVFMKLIAQRANSTHNLLLIITASPIIRLNIKIVICRLDCAGDDYAK